VLSSTITTAEWPNTKFLRSLDDIVNLKQRPGKHIYLVGGARATASLIDAGLVDELRMIVYPLIAGPGKSLFAANEHQCGLELRSFEQLSGGRVSLVYSMR
jgi:dihydrofolate reductase